MARWQTAKRKGYNKTGTGLQVLGNSHILILRIHYNFLKGFKAIEVLFKCNLEVQIETLEVQSIFDPRVRFFICGTKTWRRINDLTRVLCIIFLRVIVYFPGFNLF